MGMPIITPGTGTRDQAITDLIQSVALQETALSHILNAEGEKMQAVIAMPDITVDQLFELNDSVNKMVNAVTRLEMMFHSKLELFSGDAAAAPNNNFTAPAELAKIDIPFVTIDLPYSDPLARDAAIAAVTAAAQNQLPAGYTVVFNPDTYGIEPGANPNNYVITGTFTVTRDGVPSDTATSPALLPINVISSYVPVTTAAQELAKINTTSVVIAVPLGDSTAQAAAVTQAIAAARAVVSPDYAVNFIPGAYDPTTGTLTGRYTVSSPVDMLDTASDLNNRTIGVTTTAVAPTAASQLANINLSGVTISVPLDDLTNAPVDAVTQAIAAAQQLVLPGYTVSFTQDSYTPGMLSGFFTVTNGTDTAVGNLINIPVYTQAPLTTAANELSKINVTSVNISLPLTDPSAWSAAISNAVSKAQSLVAPGYTVTFAPMDISAYDSSVDPAILTGGFTVTSKTNATGDTASDVPGSRTITVTSVPATAASSHALARILDGTLISDALGTVLTPAEATYVNGSGQPFPVIDTTSTNLGALTGVLANLGTTSFDLGQFLQLGVVNQYAEATIDGVSRASASTVSNGGVANIGGVLDYPAAATLDLTQLIPGNPVISQATLSIGALTGESAYDAGLNVVTRDYNIAGAALTLKSPAIEAVVTGINGVLTDFGTALNGIGDTLIKGILDGVVGSLSSITSVIPGVSLESNTLKATITLDFTNAAAPLLSDPIKLTDGSIYLDLSQGTLLVDLNKFWGGTLNNFPPNTPLISSTLLNSLEDGKTAILIDLTNAVTNLITNLLASVTVNVSGHISLLTTFLGETAGLDVNLNGTLKDLVDGKAPLQLTATGLSSLLLAPLVSGISAVVLPILTSAINTLVVDPNTGLVNTAWIAANGVVKILTTAIAPIFTIIAGVLSININEQIDAIDTFTEIPVQVSLLSGLATVDFAKAVAGPNLYTV